MNKLRGRAVVLGVVLGLAWLLGMSSGEALAQSPEVRVTLTIWNKAMLAGPTYEIRTIILTRGFFPVLTQYIFPPASIGPMGRRTFEFEVAAIPDGLTITGRKDGTPFSFSFYPIYSGFTGTKDNLEVTVQITPQYPWPPYPWPPYPYPTPPHLPVDPAKIQADLAKGPRYFAIAERANQLLSPEEKARLAEKIKPHLMEAEALLGGYMPPTVKAYIPTELHATLTSIAQRIKSATIEALTVPGVLGIQRAQELNLLVPMEEVTLKPPQTHWTCYWSYVYAWWTFVCAYWNYIVNDHPLGLWTLIYAYYSYVYASWCYVVC